MRKLRADKELEDRILTPDFGALSRTLEPLVVPDIFPIFV
jgi:hypothetical protein